MVTALISHPDCLLHEMGDFHPEQPARLRAITAAINNSELPKKIKNYAAPLATREQLLRVHRAEYVEQIFQLSPLQGYQQLDPDTAMNPYTLQAALRAAGANVYAVDLIMQKEINNAFCSVRPPGHHAEQAHAMGFCFFNNIAVGVAHALAAYHLNRIAIVDFDVHHGNGTEDIFKTETRVLLCSSFQHPFYPFSGTSDQQKNKLILPLAAHTSGNEFRQKIREQWLKPLRDFQPELIFISAGFDAHAEDDMANLLLVEADYAWLTKEIRKIADQSAEGRIVSSLEGGYALEALGRSVVAHIRELI